MPPRSYKTKQKISKTMQGTSNFAGQEHSIGSKAKISIGRGNRNPIGTKKWFVHNDTAKTLRKTQNPGGLFRRGRIVKEFKTFMEDLNLNLLKRRQPRYRRSAVIYKKGQGLPKDMFKGGAGLKKNVKEATYKIGKFKPEKPDTKRIDSVRTTGAVMHGPSSSMRTPRAPVDMSKSKGVVGSYNPRQKAGVEKAIMLKGMQKKREREAEADKEVTRQETDKIRPQAAARKAAGRKLVDPKTGAEVGKQQKGIGPTPIPKGVTVQKIKPRKLPKRRKILQAGDQMLDFSQYLIEDEKKMYYNIGHKTAMAGKERGETSDNYGPMATHYNAGYDDGMKKRKTTKPNVVGKDSYGRNIVKVG